MAYTRRSPGRVSSHTEPRSSMRTSRVSPIAWTRNCSSRQLGPPDSPWSPARSSGPSGERHGRKTGPTSRPVSSSIRLGSSEHESRSSRNWGRPSIGSSSPMLSGVCTRESARWSRAPTCCDLRTEAHVTGGRGTSSRSVTPSISLRVTTTLVSSCAVIPRRCASRAVRGGADVTLELYITWIMGHRYRARAASTWT